MINNLYVTSLIRRGLLGWKWNLSRKRLVLINFSTQKRVQVDRMFQFNISKHMKKREKKKIKFKVTFHFELNFTMINWFPFMLTHFTVVFFFFQKNVHFHFSNQIGEQVFVAGQAMSFYLAETQYLFLKLTRWEAATPLFRISFLHGAPQRTPSYLCSHYLSKAIIFHKATSRKKLPLKEAFLLLTNCCKKSPSFRINFEQDYKFIIEDEWNCRIMHIFCC